MDARNHKIIIYYDVSRTEVSAGVDIGFLINTAGQTALCMTSMWGIIAFHYDIPCFDPDWYLVKLEFDWSVIGIILVWHLIPGTQLGEG